MIGRLHAQEVVDKIVVTDQEVQSYLASKALASGNQSAYHLLHILIATPDGASPEQVKAAEEKARKIVQQLRQGADFREVALANSDDKQALQGGDLGWLKPADMPALFVEPVAKLSRGEVTDPIRSASGFHILKLEDVKGGAEQHVITQTHVRQILIRTNELVSDQDARIRLSQLRQRILGGENFDALARSHSDDKGSAIKGGDLGWVNPGDTVPAFEEQMSRLQPGQVSEPFHTQFGWHIVQVLGRRQYDSTDEVRLAQARDAVRRRKAKEQIELFDRSLRDQAYVDIRLGKE
jgi:peptidyl-prolyl cis-trans isomerase SurA